MKTLILLVLASAMLYSCKDECREYSDFSCKEIQKAEYNVYFYYPSDYSEERSEEYLGEASGLSSCGDEASSFAYSKNLSGKDWGYICCMIAKGYSCYEKHR